MVRADKQLGGVIKYQRSLWQKQLWEHRTQFGTRSPLPGGICVAAGLFSAAVKRLPVSRMKVFTGNWVKVARASEARKGVCLLAGFSVSKIV